MAAYTYDAVGNRTRLDYGETLTYTTYAYDTDPRYRISGITHTPRVGSPVTIGYSRDNVGNPTAIAGVGYGYDDNSRLVTAGQTSYTYDWVGNRATPGSMVYNDADQLTSWPNQRQYTYLGTGSLDQQKDSGGTVQKTFGYTPANLLSSVVHAGVGTSSMTWDADSNRVSFTSSTGGTTQFVYDITAGIPAVIKETGSTYPTTYVREPDGSLIAMYVGGSYPYYYHFDALGSTRLLTDETGHVTDTYTYDAWGQATHDSGTILQPYQYCGQLGYYTHYQDSNLPLLQLGVRFYDPGAGRFTQVDPIRVASRSSYGYVRNLPTASVDPSGMHPPGMQYPPPAVPAGMALCDMWRCAHEMVNAAGEEAQGTGLGGFVNGPEDALKHCIGSCKMKVHCPPGTAEAAGYGHEWPIVFPGRRADSRMDLGNNKTGRECGESILRGGSYGSCLECCLKSWLNWLPSDRWR